MIYVADVAILMSNIDNFDNDQIKAVSKKSVKKYFRII